MDKPITKTESRKFQSLIRHGAIKPEDYPGHENQAFRMLIRAIRAGQRR